MLLSTDMGLWYLATYSDPSSKGYQQQFNNFLLGVQRKNNEYKLANSKP